MTTNEAETAPSVPALAAALDDYVAQAMTAEGQGDLVLRYPKVGAAIARVVASAVLAERARNAAETAQKDAKGPAGAVSAPEPAESRKGDALTGEPSPTPPRAAYFCRSRITLKSLLRRARAWLAEAFSAIIERQKRLLETELRRASDRRGRSRPQNRPQKTRVGLTKANPATSRMGCRPALGRKRLFRVDSAVPYEGLNRPELAESCHPPPGPPLHGSSRQLIADL
jgi:hypothetical protein